MTAIVYAPKSKGGQSALAERVTKIQSDFILDYLVCMDCPAAEKERMLERIIHILKEREQETT